MILKIPARDFLTNPKSTAVCFFPWLVNSKEVKLLSDYFS